MTSLFCNGKLSVLSSCTGSQEPIQKTQQCSTAKQRFVNKGVQWLFPLCTGTPGHNQIIFAVWVLACSWACLLLMIFVSQGNISEMVFEASSFDHYSENTIRKTSVSLTRYYQCSVKKILTECPFLMVILRQESKTINAFKRASATVSRD